MNLHPGCPLVVAPLFHLEVDWRERLLLGTIEEVEGNFFPSLAWRAPSSEELGVLVGDPLRLTRDEARDRALCLLSLPNHLQAAFWRMLDATQTGQASYQEEFDRFVVAVARFLEFKGMPAPPDAVFDLVASKPGQRSIQWDAATNRSIGLTFNLAPWVAWPLREETLAPRLWAGFNLGEEPVSIVYLNLPAETMAAVLADNHPDAPSPSTLDDLARGFLSHFPEYPLVRLQLQPGEGYRIPPGGLLIDACTLDIQEPGIMLMVRGGSAAG